MQAESDLLNTQKERRENQAKMEDIQRQLQQIAMKLEKVKRGDERYLSIITEEHDIIQEQRQTAAQLKNYEERERLLFAELSSAVRESHEKERARNDRTKYWSIIATVTGALIGGLGTYISNYLRMRELRGMVKDSTKEAKDLRLEISESMQRHNAHMVGFFKELRSMQGLSPATDKEKFEEVKLSEADKSTEEIAESIQKQLQAHDVLLQKELGEMKKIIGVSKAQETEGNVVYVGPELEDMLESHNKNIEWKIKMNALWTTTLIYGAFALTIPVLYAVFKGG